MTRNDLPYVILVIIFGASIFLAGRMSAPTVTVAAPVAQAVPSAPQVIVIATTSAEPKPAPVAVAEVVPVVAPSSTTVYTPSSSKTVHPKAPETKPVPSVHVELEEEPANPYRTSNTPGF